MVIDPATATIKDIVKALAIEADSMESKCQQLQQQMESMRKNMQGKIDDLEKENQTLRKNAEELREELQQLTEAREGAVPA